MSVTFEGLDMTRMREIPGIGPVPVRVDFAPEDAGYFNLANGNAAALLALLGLPADLWGECTVAEARRAIMLARAAFDRRAPGCVREGEVRMGSVVRDDGVVEIRPRFVSGGLDAAGLRDRLERFARLVEAVAAMGATHVSWA